MTREGLAEAIRLAHRALELEPRFSFVAALASISHTINVLWGFTSDPRFEHDEAVRLARLALSVDDSDPETLAIAAVTLAFMVGNPESEVEIADRAVTLNPNSFQAWHCRGWVYRVAGLPEEAIRSFESAIATNSSVVALTRLPLDKWRDDPEVLALSQKGFSEVAAVGRARGVALPADIEARALQFTRNAPPELMPSMAIDLLRGKRLELPWLGGKVVALGRELGVPTPTHDVMYAALKPYANGAPA